MSDYLPEDILINILARFPVKTWQSLISSPAFITHHLNKATIRNTSGFLFFKCLSKEGSRYRYFLYPDKDFLRCNGEELDFPLDYPPQLYYTKTHLVGSCNGLFFVCFGCYNSHEVHSAVLWNPSIRKTVPIPEPTASTLQSNGRFNEYFGFGFDSINHDYKLVRVVYFHPEPSCHYEIASKLLPLVEIYSMKSGCWRMVGNDLKCFIQKHSSSVFVDGACHWAANTKEWCDGINMIVFFNLADEKIGEMTVPDGEVCRKNRKLTVTVFDGLLSLVALSECYNGAQNLSIWAMKKYGDSQSWTKLFNIEHLKSLELYYFVGIKKNGEIFFVDRDRDLISYSTTENGSFRVWGAAKSLDFTGSFYLYSYMESLVLLNEASKEHSSHVADVDKEEERKKEGQRIMQSPELMVAENGVFLGDSSSSSATSRIVINNEWKGVSKERDFGSKNRKQKEEKEEEENGKSNLESDDEENDFPGKHHSIGSADSTVENVTNEAPKELSSSVSNADTKKWMKKKKGKCLLNFC